MGGQKFWAHGATVTIAGADVEGPVNIELPSESKGDVETTDNDSDGQRTFLPGMKDGGTFEIEVHKIPGAAGQQALRDNYDAKAEVVEFIITMPPEATDDSTTATVTFDGYVNDKGGSLPQDADETGKETWQIKVADAVTEAVS